MTDWNATQYLKFEAERTQPARDLLAKTSIDAPTSILDLGCGPGNSTALVAARYPEATVIGLDSSPDMLRQARAAQPTLQFIQQDASHGISQLGQQFDLIFSNACLQWLPDHAHLLPKLMTTLTPGGVLAVQVPMNEQAPLYQIIANVAAEPQWHFKDMTRTNRTLSPLAYHDILAANSSTFSLWTTTYYHRLPDHQALLDWVQGTRLRPYLAQLSPTNQTAFTKRILQAAQTAYPVCANGDVVFAFRRCFFVAQK